MTMKVDQASPDEGFANFADFSTLRDPTTIPSFAPDFEDDPFAAEDSFNILDDDESSDEGEPNYDSDDGDGFMILQNFSSHRSIMKGSSYRTSSTASLSSSCHQSQATALTYEEDIDDDDDLAYLPDPQKVFASGSIFKRNSSSTNRFRKNKKEKWQQYYWIRYGQSSLYMFDTKDHFKAWLNQGSESVQKRGESRDLFLKFRLNFQEEIICGSHV